MQERQTGHQPYAQRLRAIGARLDTGGYHAVSIIEVDGGLVVRASAPGSRTPEVLEIPDVDTANPVQLTRMRSGSPHRLFPDGYKGFLAALGQRLDRGGAQAIAIVEGTDFVTVGGIQPVAEADGDITFEPLDILLLATDIQSVATLPVEVDEPVIPDAAAQPAPVAAGSHSMTGQLAERVGRAVEAIQRSLSLVLHPARQRG